VNVHVDQRPLVLRRADRWADGGKHRC